MSQLLIVQLLQLLRSDRVLQKQTPLDLHLVPVHDFSAYVFYALRLAMLDKKAPFQLHSQA